jgi:hypothetical protein
MSPHRLSEALLGLGRREETNVLGTTLEEAMRLDRVAARQANP